MNLLANKIRVTPPPPPPPSPPPPRAGGLCFAVVASEYLICKYTGIYDSIGVNVDIIDD